MRSCASRRTRRASWSSNLSSRGCALLRSKYLPCSDICVVLYSTVQYCTVLYSTIQYCTVLYSIVQYNTVQNSNGTLHSCPEKSLGSPCRRNCHLPPISAAVKLYLTFVLVSVFIVYRV